MKIITKKKELQIITAKLYKEGKTIGFVPTMGALHDGHLSLIRESKKQNDITIVSIFINPLQFNNKEDLEAYPRTLKEDSKLIQDHADILFFPSFDEMYPHGFQTMVKVGDIGTQLEGEFRPGHFEGMATVILKLFHICRPSKSYFGQKDYQQVLVVRKMIADFYLPIELVMMPTIREKNGLALSSRNKRLSLDERKKAGVIYKTLDQIQKKIKHGYQNKANIEEYIRIEIMKELGITVEYVAVRKAGDLSNIMTTLPKDIVILVAVYVGKVRLIDNVIVYL